MIYTRSGVTHPLVMLEVNLALLVDSQTDVAIATGGAANGFAFPFAGSLHSMTATLSAAVGAGVLSVDVKIGSTQQGIDTVIGVAETVKSAIYPRGLYTFAANQLIIPTYTAGVLTTNGGITVRLWVLLDDAVN